MPKELFFNLSKEKQNRLIQASKEEFSRVPFEEVSINKIIKNADISRGSFYTYFENKEDLLEYIMSEYRDCLVKDLLESFDNDNVDIFNVFENIFENIIVYINGESNINLCKNVFSNLKIKENLAFTKEHDQLQEICTNKMLEKINIDKLNIETKEDVKDIISILVSIMKESIVEITCFKSNIDETKKRYLNKIRLIKKGLYK